MVARPERCERGACRPSSGLSGGGPAQWCPKQRLAGLCIFLINNNLISPAPLGLSWHKHADSSWWPNASHL